MEESLLLALNHFFELACIAGWSPLEGDQETEIGRVGFIRQCSEKNLIEESGKGPRESFNTRHTTASLHGEQ